MSAFDYYRTLTQGNESMYMYMFICTLLDVFNEGAYLTFKSIFHKALKTYTL